MKNLIKYTGILILAVTLGSLAGCSNYLDRQPLSQYLASNFYNNENAISAGVNGCYQMLYQNQESSSNIPTMTLWDSYTPIGIERADNSSIGVGNVDLRTNFTVEWTWATLYQSVARCNTVLDGAKPYIDGLSLTAKQYYSEALTLRAYYYWELVSLYGDIPFFTSSVTTDQTKGVTMTPWRQVVDSLLVELDDASQYLPWTYTAAEDWGRADKSFALGLKARIALYAGSWCTFGFGKDGDQKDQTAATNYFTIAAQAAKNVMDYSGRSLCPSYNDLFTRVGQLTTAAQSENIFQIIYSDQGVKKTHYLTAGEASRMFGQSGRFPTQQLVDIYECSNGKRIDDPSSGYNPADPFKNRDPRLKYTIYTQHDTIIGNSGGNKIKFLMEVYKPQVESFDDAGNITMLTNQDYTGSVAQYGYVQSGVGYLWKKYNFFDDEDVFTPSYNIILMRYAEILLTYAEAQIELNQLDPTVYDAIDQVRARVGMPSILSVDPSRAGNQVKMRQIVRRERKVELAKESLYFFDMRRWRLGAMQNAEPTYGYPLAVGVNPATNTYPDGYSQATPDMVPSFGAAESPQDLNDVPSYAAYASKLRVRDISRPQSWDDKYYVWPIPNTELTKAPWLTQKPGY